MNEVKYTDMSLTDEQLALIGIKSKPETEQYLQVKDVRYTLDEFNRVGDYLLGRKLTDDQQVVLDWLKSNVEQDNASPILSITLLGTLWESRKFNIKEDIRIDDAYSELDYKQQAQVLQAFANWALEQEDNN